MPEVEQILVVMCWMPSRGDDDVDAPDGRAVAVCHPVRPLPYLRQSCFCRAVRAVSLSGLRRGVLFGLDGRPVTGADADGRDGRFADGEGAGGRVRRGCRCLRCKYWSSVEGGHGQAVGCGWTVAMPVATTRRSLSGTRLPSPGDTVEVVADGARLRSRSARRC